MANPSNGRWDIDRGTAGRTVEGRTSQRAYRPTIGRLETPPDQAQCGRPRRRCGSCGMTSCLNGRSQAACAISRTPRILAIGNERAIEDGIRFWRIRTPHEFGSSNVAADNGAADMAMFLLRGTKRAG